MKKVNTLMKTILVFIAYLSYTFVVNSIFNLFGLNNDILISFIADVLFLIGIVAVYKDDLKKSILDYYKSNKFGKRLLNIVIWVAIIFSVNLIGGILTEILFPNISFDDNTIAIYSLANLSTLYTLFKVFIFSTFAEELVFKKSIRNVVENNVLFIILSSFLYAFMNIAIYQISVVSVVDFIQSFIFSSILCTVFIKNKDNSFMIMVIKFFYNLIPLTILLLGIGA